MIQVVHAWLPKEELYCTLRENVTIKIDIGQGSEGNLHRL